MSLPRASFDGLPATLSVNIFANESALRDTVIEAIATAPLPWDCSNELIDAARAQAIRCVLSGTGPSSEIIDQLRRHLFASKRDAHHGMAKLCIIGS
jgi:hypothetical protein